MDIPARWPVHLFRISRLLHVLPPFAIWLNHPRIPDAHRSFTTIRPEGTPFTDEGRDFYRRSCEAWGEAIGAAGTDPARSTAMWPATTGFGTTDPTNPADRKPVLGDVRAACVMLPLVAGGGSFLSAGMSMMHGPR